MFSMSLPSCLVISLPSCLVITEMRVLLLGAAADIKRACHMAQKLVFYYGMSAGGITTWAQQPYHSDFYVNQNRPRKVRAGEHWALHLVVVPHAAPEMKNPPAWFVSPQAAVLLPLPGYVPAWPHLNMWGTFGLIRCFLSVFPICNSLQVVSTDAMDEYADWPTRNEDFRFDPLSPSDPIWHKYVGQDASTQIRTCVGQSLYNQSTFLQYASAAHACCAARGS